METNRVAIALSGLSVVAVLGIGALAWSQDAEIKRLRAQVESLEEASVTGDSFEPASGEEEVALRRRLRALEGEVARLRRVSGQAEVVRGGESNSASAQAEAVEAAAPALAPRQEAVLSVLESEDPGVRGRLRELFREENERLREERMNDRRDRWEAEALDRFATFSQEAKLTARQSRELEPALERERDQLFELSRSRRRGEVTREDFAAQRQAIREETDEKARAVLDSEQVTKYQAMREEESRRFGRGRRGRR